MKQKNEKNYYEFLEITPAAGLEEIEAACRSAKAIYSDDSVAVYSLYTAEERQEMLTRLGDMHATLTDPVKRKGYDEYLRSTGIARRHDWDVHSVQAGKDIFEEYTEVGAFKDKLSLRQPLTVMDGQDPMVVERYRILYMKLEQAALKNSYKTFAITSSVKGEGKTMTALNLSYVMATEFKKKVLLVESDLRNPTISTSWLDMGRLHGLVDVLKGDSDCRASINRLEDTNLYFLPARCSVKNSSVLLDSPNMRTVLNKAKEDFDYVIVDSPPILPLADISILSKAVDGLLLVVRAGVTPKDIVAKAVNSLPRQNIIGIVLNGADDAHMKKYYY